MKFCVTVTRTGCLYIEAATEEEAMAMANHQITDTVLWDEDWMPTDCTEDDSADDYITEKLLNNDLIWRGTKMEEYILKVLDEQLDEVGFIVPNQSEFYSCDSSEFSTAIQNLIDKGILRIRDCVGTAYEYNKQITI